MVKEESFTQNLKTGFHDFDYEKLKIALEDKLHTKNFLLLDVSLIQRYLTNRGLVQRETSTNILYFITDILPKMSYSEVEKFWISKFKFDKFFKKVNKNITYMEIVNRVKKDMAIVHIFFDMPTLLKTVRSGRATFMDKAILV